MKTTFAIVTATSVFALATAAWAADQWDMPMGYSASNFHSVTGAEFAQCVTIGSGGELEIVTHPGGSLFKGNEIKRAVQTGQVQIGERLLSAHQNEDALFGVDSIPFLATSFEASTELWEAAKPEYSNLLDSQNLHLVYSVPWPPQGLYFKQEVNAVADMGGIKFRSYNTATAPLGRADRHVAGADRGGGNLAGIRHRRCRIHGLVRVDRLRTGRSGRA